MVCEQFKIRDKSQGSMYILLHAQCSWDRLWSKCDSGQSKGLTEDEDEGMILPHGPSLSFFLPLTLMKKSPTIQGSSQFVFSCFISHLCRLRILHEICVNCGNLETADRLTLWDFWTVCLPSIFSFTSDYVKQKCVRTSVCSVVFNPLCLHYTFYPYYNICHQRFVNILRINGVFFLVFGFFVLVFW